MQQETRTQGAEQGVLAVLARGKADGLRTLAQQAGLQLHGVGSTQELLRLPSPPVAAVLPLESSLEEWATLRESPDFAATPLLGLSSDASELAFAEAFARGGEDLLLLGEPEETLLKLRAIPLSHRAAPSAPRRVLVVGHDPGWRRGAARRLRGAGFRVDFAGTPEEATELARQGEPALVLVDATADLTFGAELAAKLREGGLEAPMLVSVAPNNLGRGRAMLAGHTKVMAHDAHGLADALLFLVNEMTAGAVVERRNAPRMLFGTRVWARQAGADNDRVGYSYTISEGGLFIRSLAPFPVGSRIWLELCPPRNTHRVRLVATAVWARGFGALDSAVSPPGTGLRIEGGLPGDWERYRVGCQSLLTPSR